MVKSTIVHSIQDLMRKNDRNIRPNGDIAYVSEQIYELENYIDILIRNNRDTDLLYRQWYGDKDTIRTLDLVEINKWLADILGNLSWLDKNQDSFDPYHYQIIRAEYQADHDKYYATWMELNKPLMSRDEFVEYMLDMYRAKLVGYKADLNHMEALANSFNSPQFQKTIKLLKLA